MGSFSDYLENKLLNHSLMVSSFSQPSALYIGLSLADPVEDGSGISEPSATGNYARVNYEVFDVASSRSLANTNIFTFNQASNDWGTITHWFISDGLTGGNMLVYGSFTTPKTINATNTPQINAGDLTVSFSANGISTYLANAFLDHTFKNTAYTAPTNLYVGLSTGLIGDGGSITGEPAVGAYARVSNTSWTTSTAGIIKNSAGMTFPTATTSWGTIAYAFIADSITGQNVLFHGAVASAQAITVNDIPQFSASAFSLTAD